MESVLDILRNNRYYGLKMESKLSIKKLFSVEGNTVLTADMGKGVTG